MDFSAAPPSYSEIAQTDQSQFTEEPISVSPHQSDDEDTARLKEELRRLRDRNKRALRSPNTVSGGAYSTPSTSQHHSTTVQYTNSGPIYRHPVTTAVIPNSQGVNTTQISGTQACMKSVATCVVVIIVFVVIVFVIMATLS